jgi:broad specificity phosphatase PhoE
MSSSPAGRRTVVHMMRHGEVHNPDKILYGRLPGYRLSDRGVLMAETVADFLAGRDITYLVASPLERAQQTAAPISERLGVPVDSDERLIESANWFEGKRFGIGDGALKNPSAWPKLRNPFRPSWGEPYSEIARRMTAALHDARDRGIGHEVVCVSHQLPVWTLRCYAEGRRLWHDPRRRQCALASLTSFHFDGLRLTDITYSEPAADVVATSPVAQEHGA